MTDSKCKPITHVAVRIGSPNSFAVWFLPKPMRHHHILHIMYENGMEEKLVEWDQGFLDSDGKFLTRSEALLNAIENNQLICKTSPVDLLFSEDLW